MVIWTERFVRRMIPGGREMRMFKVGEYINYGTAGACEVIDITTLNMDGVPKERLYYILMPCGDSKGRLFTPVDNERVAMRPLLSKEEADALIREIPEIEQIWVGNDKLREETYKKAMKSGECREWIRIIKTLYLRKQQRIRQGKKTTAMDERYLKLAEDRLYSELSISLGLPKGEMADYIAGQIDALEPQQI